MDHQDAAATVDALARAWAVPGVAVALTTAEGIAWQYVHGFADLARRSPLTPDHLLQIGSISKIATAMLVQQCAEERLLDLDRPIGEVLPWLPSVLRGRTLTLHRLLTHTGGLVGSVDALPDERAQLATFRGTCVDDGTFRYSNVGYLLLGQAVARVRGVPFPEAVRRGILIPAGMHASAPAVSYDDRQRYASGHEPARRDRPWAPGDDLVAAPFFETTAGDGSMATPLGDLAAFARVLLRGGLGDDGPVLGEAAFAEMVGSLATGGEDVLVVPGAGELRSSRYGRGINVEEWSDGPALSHGGGMVGFASFLLARPAAGHAIVVLTNADGDSPVAEAIARCLDVVLSGSGGAIPQPSLWAPRSGNESLSASAGRIVPPRLPATATGRFRSADGRMLSIVQDPCPGDDPGAGQSDGGFSVSLDHATGPLLWTWSGRYVARLDGLDRFALTYHDGGWFSGGTAFTRVTESADDGKAQETTTTDDPRCGHYRSYTPWYPHLRIVQRGDALVLIAPRGVEAPADDQPLTPLPPPAEALFRIGNDPDAPERLRFGPIVDGACVWVERDGCVYSRTSSP